MRQGFTAIVIPTYERNAELRLNLKSMAEQTVENPFEVLVMDDCPQEDQVCKELCEDFAKRLPLRYIHSGQTKTNDYWRVPGFALNIGFKQTDAEYGIICCAEIYHFDNTIDKIVNVLREKKKVMAIPFGKKDGGYIPRLIAEGKLPTEEDFEKIGVELRVTYPYFMGFHIEDYYGIGGYDEDFTGIAADDDDFIRRMKSFGCRYHHAHGMVAHLKHDHRKKNTGTGLDQRQRIMHNRRLLRQRTGRIIANQGREWGKL